MFWGLIMEPNKRYTQNVEKPFHISQAAMDISTGDNEPCQVMVVVEGKNFLACTLQKNKCLQVPMDLYFKPGDLVSFLTNGKCNIHLTGYVDPELEEEGSDEEEEEEEETPSISTKNKRKLTNNEEAPVNKKAKQDKKVSKKAVAKEDSESDSDDDDNDKKDIVQKFLDGEEVDSDDNDSKNDTSADTSDSSDESEDDEDSDDEEEENEADEEKDDDEQDSSEEAEITLDTSKEEEIDTSKLSKSQKKRLKKKLQQQKKAQSQVNGVDKTKKDESQPQQKAEKKKPEGKKEAQEALGDKKEKKTLSGGVFIEDIKIGSGPIAKPGKTVLVYYEGRMKQNNKMFDNCQKGPGFKFKLGGKEVISGWDVGVSGMKVGGKRKIVCPPAMAYGAKGSPPVIPPNTALVFEVELKSVK